MHTIDINDTVKDILRRSEVTSDRLKLPDGQLAREDYEAVNKALTKLGGKWNRSARAHIFSSDPRITIKALIDGEEVVDQKKEFQEFFTPAATADKLVQVAASLFKRSFIPRSARVLEPSVGDGALLRALQKKAPKVTDITTYDINEKWVKEQKRLGIDATLKDFLLVKPPKLEEKKFDLVLMNPPFQKRLDAKHVLHAWEFLKEDGVLTAIVSPGFRFRDDKVYQDMKHIADYHSNYDDGFVEELPEGTFKEAGTNVRTFMIGWVKY